MTLAIVVGAPELGVGLVMGMAYALLGIGLVLIYRTTKVIHFGYGEVGMFGALILARLVLDLGWSWWIAFPVVVAGGAAVSALWERTVIRRLFDAPRLIVLVATIGIGQVMLASQLILPEHDGADSYPVPLHVTQELGSWLLRGDHIMVLMAVPLAAVALTFLLNHTIWGVALRGSADNKDAASLAGVHVRRMSTLVWALAGALSVATFVLILPVRGVVLSSATQAIGPGLLLRALAVGLVGRMESMTFAAAGGVCFGVIEAVLLANVAPGTVDLLILATVLALLVTRGVASYDITETLSGGLARRTLDAREKVRAASMRRIAVALVLLVAVLAPLITDSPGRQFRLTTVLVFAMVGISVTVITGWAGQVSLCQFALVGVGAMFTAGLTARGMAFGWSAVYATAIAAAIAVVVGLPALRLRGLNLATATLAFAVAAHSWLFNLDTFAVNPGSITVNRPSWGFIDFADQRNFYYLCLVILVVTAYVVSALRRTGVGRTIIAVRENEAAASAFTIGPARMKLLAFAMSGAIAGLAGALYGALYVRTGTAAFSPEQSFQVLAMTIVGGVFSVGGAVLGAAYVVGVPQLFGDSLAASLLTSGVGLLALLMITRGGLFEILLRVRDRLLALNSEPTTAEVKKPPPTGAPSRSSWTADLPVTPRRWSPDRDSTPVAPALECRGIEVRFSGLVANHDVNLTVGTGETVGLIGTNGAGKSTLMNAVTGLVRTSGGTIRAFGNDITGWTPQDRAQLGIGRVFQDARLFPDLTAFECILVALEPIQPTEFVPSLLALPPARSSERWRRAAADDLVSLLGLGGYANKPVAELSTGTRRLVELACVVATGARLLLLDEPTAGVAQREVEALGGTLEDIKNHLEASVLLIEHDMPLVMSLSDRIVCMVAGEVLAAGTPDVIRHDESVIAAYLGTDDRAIERTDVTRIRDRSLVREET